VPGGRPPKCTALVPFQAVLENSGNVDHVMHHFAAVAGQLRTPEYTAVRWDSY